MRFYTSNICSYEKTSKITIVILNQIKIKNVQAILLENKSFASELLEKIWLFIYFFYFDRIVKK